MEFNFIRGQGRLLYNNPSARPLFAPVTLGTIPPHVPLGPKLNPEGHTFPRSRKAEARPVAPFILSTRQNAAGEVALQPTGRQTDASISARPVSLSMLSWDEGDSTGILFRHPPLPVLRGGLQAP